MDVPPIRGRHRGGALLGFHTALGLRLALVHRCARSHQRHMGLREPTLRAQQTRGGGVSEVYDGNVN